MAPLRSLFAFFLTLGATSAFTPAKPASAKVTRYGDSKIYDNILQLVLDTFSWLKLRIPFSCATAETSSYQSSSGNFNFDPFLSILIVFVFDFCSVAASSGLTPPGVYEDAVADWEKQFPQFAKYGWGPSVQAEKWNGRHAMCKF